MPNETTSVPVEAYIDGESTLHVIAMTSPPEKVRLSTIDKHSRSDAVLVPAHSKRESARAMHLDFGEDGRPIPRTRRFEMRVCSACMQQVPFATDPDQPPAAFCSSCGAPLSGQRPLSRTLIR